MFGNCRSMLFTVSLLQFLLSAPGLSAQPTDFQKSLQEGLSSHCPTPDLYSTQRPDPKGTATKASVAAAFVDILDVQDSNQTFTVDAWLMLSWKDPRLADPARGTAQAVCEVDWDRHWSPRIQIGNLREFETQYRDVTLIDAQGTIALFRRGLITVFSRFDLQDFPYDKQELTLAVESLLGIEDVEFLAWEDLVDVRQISATSWRFSEPRATVRVEQAKLTKRSVFTMTLTAKREPNFFARKLIVPVGLIVFMAYAIFWISPTQIAPQTGIGATSMLTLIAYQFALSGYLPRISYLTRADFFLLWSLVLVFVALAEAIATAGLMNYGKEGVVRKMDAIFRVLYPAAFVLILYLAVY